ncbi:MAG: TonB-dependent receptor, partial [Prevotellaceae bacterium]|nr:TonB-dependent receptor [Prevotellaceae bacterium]
MKKITLTLTLLGVFSLLHAQRSVPDSLLWSFHSQLSLFPQEKLHLHIDKSYYLSGEKIWFRAYLVDATTHKPTTDSRFVYIELINP